MPSDTAPHVVLSRGTINDLAFAGRVEVRGADGATLGWLSGFVSEEDVAAARRAVANPEDCLSSHDLRRELGLPPVAEPVGAAG